MNNGKIMIILSVVLSVAVACLAVHALTSTLAMQDLQENLRQLSNRTTRLHTEGNKDLVTVAQLNALRKENDELYKRLSAVEEKYAVVNSALRRLISENQFMHLEHENIRNQINILSEKHALPPLKTKMHNEENTEDLQTEAE